MTKALAKLMEDLGSTDDKTRFAALQSMLKATEGKVDWAYEAWDLLAAKLGHENSYQRSIGAMLLCNLAKSDSKARMKKDVDALLRLTADEKFITTRQCIQSLWKVAAANAALGRKVVDHLAKRFEECSAESHFNLIRQDIVDTLRKTYDQTGDEAAKRIALALIDKEADPKNRRKYLASWKGA